MGSIPNGSAPLQACARQIFIFMPPGRTGKAQVSIFQELCLALCGRIWRVVVILGAQCVGSRWPQWVVWPPSSSGSGGGWAASGYTHFQAIRSFGCSSPWWQAYLGHSRRVRRRRGSSLINMDGEILSAGRSTRGQEPATSTIFLGGYSPQRAEAGSGRGGASRYEWGGQWQTTISRHAGATCCGLRSGASVSVKPISCQQCHPFWACNGTRPAVRRRPPAVVPLSKE
jgi:hypothetical protein